MIVVTLLERIGVDTFVWGMAHKFLARLTGYSDPTEMEKAALNQDEISISASDWQLPGYKKPCISVALTLEHGEFWTAEAKTAWDLLRGLQQY